MKIVTTSLALFALLYGLLTGCADAPGGARSPITTTDGGDAGPSDTNPADQMAVADGSDANTPADVAPSDGGTDVQTDASVDAPRCERASYDAGFCEGSVICTPNLYDPTCERAAACDCNMQDSAFDPLLCAGSNLATCRTAARCTPGHNHCSPNLPAGVDYAQVTSLEPRDGHGGLARLLNETGPSSGWRRTDLTSGSGGFLSSDGIYNNRGFVHMSIGIPIDLDGVPPDMAGQIVRVECSSDTCYWNRGPLEMRGPSIGVLIRNDGCTIEVRYYIDGEASPVRTYTYSSLSSHC